MRGKQLASIASCLAIQLWGLAAGAGAWEFAYGPANTSDRAYRRVAPVLTCPAGPGYVAVGTQRDLAGNDSDVYVVHTDLAGWSWPMWETVYDVQDSHLDNEGIAIVEIPFTGFVVLSNTWSGAWYPALTMIDCWGNPLWTQIYRDAIAGADLRGQDLIRTQTGDPLFGTAAGDFAVAGIWGNGAAEDAFLMRTDAGGNLIWNFAYQGGGQEAFNALTEAAPLPGQVTGDLVAVGRFNKVGSADLQGLASRVSGDAGTLGGAPQCMAIHGLPQNQDVYSSVIQLANPGPFFGQFAMVGTTSNPAWRDDIWVVRGNPCAVGGQTRIGNAGGAVTIEQGHDLREVLAPSSPDVPVGSLAIAGQHLGPWGGSEAYILFVGIGPPPPMMPIFGALFGDFGPGRESFFSLAESPAGWPQPGFILAGYTSTDWQWVGDPLGLYLVQYDPVGPGCYQDWNPAGVPTGSPVQLLAPQLAKPAKGIPVPTPAAWQWNPWMICF